MKTIQNVLFSTALILAAAPGQASDLAIPNTFTSGTPAVAAQVNANFAAVETAVDDNNARITALESNPSFSGNLTLENSTDANTGNIMKGIDRFLHNYGSDNTFLGVAAGNFTMTGSGNTAIGLQALASNTTGLSNTAIGRQALTSNTEGNNNIAIGLQALTNNTTGLSNTASGASALFSNTTGNNNAAYGYNALTSNTTGTGNTASGYGSLYGNTIGAENTASGNGALSGNTTGNYNTASGSAALTGNTTGSNNIAIGYQAGVSLTTGNHNIVIANAGAAAESNTIHIGNDNHTRTFIAGIRNVTTGIANGNTVLIDTNGQLGTVNSSREIKDHIRDMGDTSGVLNQLRPVTFYYKSDQNPDGRILQYGLVAEEVANVAPGLVAHSANGKIESVYYHFLAPMLLNEYQKQQRTIEAQAREIAELKQQVARVATLEQQMARLNAAIAGLPAPERIAATEAASR